MRFFFELGWKRVLSMRAFEICTSCDKGPLLWWNINAGDMWVVLGTPLSAMGRYNNQQHCSSVELLFFCPIAVKIHLLKTRYLFFLGKQIDFFSPKILYLFCTVLCHNKSNHHFFANLLWKNNNCFANISYSNFFFWRIIPLC